MVLSSKTCSIKVNKNSMYIRTKDKIISRKKLVQFGLNINNFPR